MTGHWIIVPVILPAMVAPLIVLAARHDIVLQRVFSAASTVALLVVAIALWVAAGAGPEAYRLGDWPAPFGIVLVLDRLSALMLLLTAILGVAVLLAAMGGFDERGRHFHALFQFQLMGVNGAFLTGDIFNLFVFFEVLLIASYGLMLHAAGPRALRAGFQYVVVNLTGSTLFLFAVGLLYGVTGTLNLADLIVKVPLVPEADRALLRVGALLLLAVFAIKAALVPLHFWLPGTYASAGLPVAALFAIMTKVGAYAILRVFTTAFGAGAGAEAWLAAPWLLPAALVTAALGVVGVVAARTLRDQAAFAVVASMGTLLTAVGLFTPEATTAALFYLVSSTLAAAILFLVADLVATSRGEAGDRVVPAPPGRGQDLLAGLFMIAAVLSVGLPPLSSFVGKLLILDAAIGGPHLVAVWSVILGTSLVAMIGFGRSGSTVFWKGTTLATIDGAAATPPAIGTVVAVGGLIAATVLFTTLAGPASDAFHGISVELHDPSAYVRAVLGTVGEAAP